MPTLLAPTDPVTVANRLRPVLLKLNRHLRREIHSVGLSGGQVSLLVTIQRNPGIGIRELAGLERMSAPGMSKYVSGLEAAGLVAREPALADRRRIGRTSRPRENVSCARSSRGAPAGWPLA